MRSYNLRYSAACAIIFIGFAVSSASHSAPIQWVDFSGYPTGTLSQSGLSSSDGLEITAPFSNDTNIRATTPDGFAVLLDDPAWPFDNSDLSTLFVIGNGTINTDLTFDFTSAGGLPSGGSLAIVDLERLGSSVTLAGFVNGFEVPVNWSAAFYQTAGVNVDPPIWNPSTNTLSGSGEIVSTTNNFAFLITGIQLDAVVFDINAPAGDGITFGVSTTSVPPSQVPAPSPIALFFIAFLAIRAKKNVPRG